MAKARIGHFVEAQVLQAIGVDYIDESEVLTPADYAHHIDKHAFTVPFVCGATNLGEALRRIAEGAAMIRSKGEAGTGDVSRPRATSARSAPDPQAHRPGAGGAVHRGQGAPGALRPGRADAAAGPAPRRAVHRRRRRHAGRRGDDDAARRRRRLHRLRHLQVRRPGAPRPRLRRGDRLLRRRRAIAKVSRGLGEAMVGIDPRQLPATCSPPAAGERARPQGRRARAPGRRPRALAALDAGGADAVPVRRAAELDGLDGLVMPGGESTTIGRLLVLFDLLEPLRAAVAAGCPSSAPAPA